MQSGKAIMITGLLALGWRLTQFAQAQAAGSLDTTFGTGGTVNHHLQRPDRSTDRAVQQSNGDIVVVSQFDFQSDAGTGVGVTRYTAAGKLGTLLWNRGKHVHHIPTSFFKRCGLPYSPTEPLSLAAERLQATAHCPGQTRDFD